MGFMDLPLEICREVYRHSLLRTEAVQYDDFGILWKRHHLGSASPRSKHRAKQFLLLSKQTSTEALDVLYGENVFALPMTFVSFSRSLIYPANRVRLRNIQLTCGGMHNPQELGLDTILQNLIRLDIIADRVDASPEKIAQWVVWMSTKRQKRNALEEKRQQWRACLRSWLPFLDGKTSDTVSLLVALEESPLRPRRFGKGSYTYGKIW